jgi:tetratricopeptide (TPR) repeat protein
MHSITRICLLLIAAALHAQIAWETPFHRGETLQRDGNYAAAVHEFRAALNEARHFGPADQRLPLTLHHLASAHLVLGQLSRAEASYREAYELRLATLGADHPLTASSLHGLALVLHERRRYREADELYSQAAAVLERRFGADAVEAADVWHNHALLYRDMHRDAEARTLLERAAATYERHAPQNAKLAIILRNLADLENSGELYERALQICKAALPPGHPQTAIIVKAYAIFLQKTNRAAEARALLAQTNSTVSVAALAK